MVCVICIGVSILSIIIGTIVFFKWKYLYWSNKKIPCIQPRIPFGTSENPFRKNVHSGVLMQQYYHHFKSLGHKYGGLYFFARPGLLLVDIDVIRNVMTKDFQYFTDRGSYHNEKTDPLSAHLFNIEGNKWRTLRASLTPTFTSGKLKLMLPTLVACGHPLHSAVKKYGQQPVDIKDLCARFTTDVIGSCAFGLECNSFEDHENEFRKFGKLAFSARSKLIALKSLIAFSSPNLAKRLGLSLTQPEVQQFFLKIVRDTVKYRRQNNVVRNDFMQLLIDLKNEDGSKRELSIEELAAQVFVFFAAGFETSSSTMSFCLLELALNQKIQSRLRDEINTVLEKYGGNITYEAVSEMKYLSHAVDETLRKYPPALIIPRICTQDYTIPGTKDVIQKGTFVFIPVYALHNDPEYFQNPDVFDPERFNEKIKPFTYIPFGEGPRVCIGMRFGLLQTKVGLITLLKDFRFAVSDTMQLPIQLSPNTVVLSSKESIWLNAEVV